MTNSTPTVPVHNVLIEALCQELGGTWDLTRRLQSNNTSEPAGRCRGIATFKPREPSVFVDDSGKLNLATAELVYHEQGEFEMQQAASSGAAVPTFTFSKKYIWRFQQRDGQKSPTLTIWFTKPGTETIDYLFHQVDITPDAAERPGSDGTLKFLSLEGHGGHLCEQDYYNSSYTFDFGSSPVPSHPAQPPPGLVSWTMLHEVRGPQKDQVIETHFTKNPATVEKL